MSLPHCRHFKKPRWWQVSKYTSTPKPVTWTDLYVSWWKTDLSGYVSQSKFCACVYITLVYKHISMSFPAIFSASRLTDIGSCKQSMFLQADISHVMRFHGHCLFVSAYLIFLQGKEKVIWSLFMFIKCRPTKCVCRRLHSNISNAHHLGGTARAIEVRMRTSHMATRWQLLTATELQIR